jgi:hypothetical protein
MFSQCDNLGLALKAEAGMGSKDELNLEDLKKSLVRSVANTNRGKVLLIFSNGILDSSDI